MFYLEEARLDVLADDPYRALLEALLLRFQPNLLNILPLYVALLLIFALALPLLRRPMLLLLPRWRCYGVARLTGLNLSSGPARAGILIRSPGSFCSWSARSWPMRRRECPGVRWPLDLRCGRWCCSPASSSSG